MTHDTTAPVDTDPLDPYDLRLLTAADTTFSVGPGGLPRVTVTDACYLRVGFIRLFPIRWPDKYISVRDGGGEEIGIIEDLAAFPAEARRIVDHELSITSHLPTIHDLLELDVQREVVNWKVRTDHGVHEFTTKRRSSIRHLADGRLIVSDTEACRYLLDRSTLPRRARSLIAGLV